jgi:transposase
MGVLGEVSMSSKRYTPEFRAEAVRQVTERGYPVSEVARRLGVSTFSFAAFGRPVGLQQSAGWFPALHPALDRLQMQ